MAQLIAANHRDQQCRWRRKVDFLTRLMAHAFTSSAGMICRIWGKESETLASSGKRPTTHHGTLPPPSTEESSIFSIAHIHHLKPHANVAALASPPPPSYEAISSSLPVKNHATVSNALHPRVAVLLGVNARWHIPLLICRALSTAPAVWWGLRCALTFLGELLLSDGDGKGAWELAWSVEKRFRVTEVFLAILWVRWALREYGQD